MFCTMKMSFALTYAQLYETANMSGGVSNYPEVNISCENVLRKHARVLSGVWCTDVHVHVYCKGERCIVTSTHIYHIRIYMYIQCKFVYEWIHVYECGMKFQDSTMIILVELHVHSTIKTCSPHDSREWAEHWTTVGSLFATTRQTSAVFSSLDA